MLIKNRLLAHVLLCLALMLASPFAVAGEGKIDWLWKLERSALYDSQLSITLSQGQIIRYEFACDLGDAMIENIDHPPTASINAVVTSSNPEGVLILTCYVGAHSERLYVIDPLKDDPNATDEITGSYFVEWRLENGQLFIRYDEPCVDIVGKSCNAPFSAVEVPWP